MRVRKKPVEVEAWLFDRKIAEKEYQSETKTYPMVTDLAEHDVNPDYAMNLPGRFGIQTLEGGMTVSDGDYIIKGVNGEFYPCKPDIFDKTYDVLDSD